MVQISGNDEFRKRRKRRRPSEPEVSRFLRQYARKAYPKYDPNDRSYSRTIERKVKQMRPEDLDRLIRGEVDYDPESSTDIT